MYTYIYIYIYIYMREVLYSTRTCTHAIAKHGTARDMQTRAHNDHEHAQNATSDGTRHTLTRTYPSANTLNTRHASIAIWHAHHQHAQDAENG